MSCVACGGALEEASAAWLLRCARCHLWRSRLDEEELGASRLHEDEREAGLEPLRRSNFERILDRLVRLVPRKGARLLEVGCGHGWFLAGAHARGFLPFGIEPDSPVAARARALGSEVREGLFPDCLREEERFDLIVFNDVFEHLADPRGALAACARHLSPGGLLVLNLPDANGTLFRLGSLLARAGSFALFDRLWQRGFPSPHVYYFRSRNLRALVEAGGFDWVEETRLPSIQLRGLRARLRMDPTLRGPGAALAFGSLTLAYPFLRWVLPSDIFLQVYRRR